MIRAIVVGQAINNNDENLKSIKDCRIKLQYNRAIEIIKNCDLPEDGPYSINILNKISDYIQNNIIVINGDLFNSISFKSGDKYQKNIYLLYNDGHYDIITSPTAFYGAPYYCDKFNTPYRNKNNHKCNNHISFVDRLN